MLLEAYLHSMTVKVAPWCDDRLAVRRL